MIPDRKALVNYLLTEAGSPLEARALMKRFNLAPKEEAEFLALLTDCVDSGDAVEIKGGQYAHPSRVGLVVGRLSMHPDGYGFIIPDDKEAPDVHVRGVDLLTAMHGDRIVARVEQRGRRSSGRIIRILKRANERLLGILRMRKRLSLVVPLDERIMHHILVGRDDLGGAADGQIVEVELLQFPTHDTPPEGRVTHVLGYPGEEDVEANAIALKHGVRIEFSEEVEAEAKAFPAKVRPADRKGREDLREVSFVTIDGEKARDFDDAVHVENTPDGAFRLRVAIADVSHYVKPGTRIDDEALARGTSTYFPDRVFPMLPEALSNNLCSLVPRQDRLAMVADMEFTRGGRRRASSFYCAVIKSAHRLTYTEVACVLDDPDCEEAAKLGTTATELIRMWELGRLIRARRRERGSIDFDLPEAEIVLDLQGKPEDIVRSERNHAHFLIEEFMIAANEAVAEFLENHKLPAPFRIHEPPDPEKVEDFRRFIHNFGYTLKARDSVHPVDFQELVDQSAGKPEARMIHQVMLRTMKKAVYHYENLGHFGLASTHYLHFTSPIRRYPDLIVHRLLKRAISGRLPKNYKEAVMEELVRECPRLSERERASESAEREAVSWKKCQFMADKIGSVHWGFVTGVASFGFFVELEHYFVDGLVHVSSLKDDFYHHSDQMQALIGERTHRRFRIGDRVRISVERVNVERRQIDFNLAPEGK